MVIRRFVIVSVCVIFATWAKVPPFFGYWDEAPNALPDHQLPHVPLLGNGRLGAAFDSNNKHRSSYPFPGSPDSIDIYLNTNSFWSCLDKDSDGCRAADPDGVAPACCSVAALGGLSISLHQQFPDATKFRAFQFIGNGTVLSQLVTPQNSILSVTSTLDPSRAVILVSLSWAASGTDPVTIATSVSLWMQGRHGADGGWNTGVPAPTGVGCASSSAGSPQPCVAGPSTQLLYASRTASTSTQSKVMPVLGALAARIEGAVLSTAITSNVSATTAPAVVTAVVQLVSGATPSSVLVAEAETRGSGCTDPTPTALADVLAANSSEISHQSSQFFSDFWQKSSLTLPSRPRVEQLWYGALYALAGFSSDDASVAAGGLYGPWATMDGPNWHGDYTLDYNYIASFFGAYTSNHGDRAASYFAPITDWITVGQMKAQKQAALAHVQCPSNTLYYACHIAPWGLQSLDPMTRYMSWNGHFTALPFISRFEYTNDVNFTLTHTLPLLEGLNSWWACFLNKTLDPTAPDGYYYNDVNSFNPDYEHEGQQVPNPTIAMAFVRRTIRAHVDIARRLKDIAAHLPPLNTANVSIPNNITILNHTRCHSDSWTWTEVPDLDACASLCAFQPGCAVFSYCPPVGQDGCTGQADQPTPLHCWGYTQDKLAGCAKQGNWTSGIVSDASGSPASILTAYRGAKLANSDWFSLYDFWPTENMDWTDAGADLTRAAQLSSRLYLSFPNGRGVDVFSMAARSGTGASPYALTPGTVLRGLEAFMDNYFGPNQLCYAPGGGIENAGMLQAISDLLFTATPNAQGASGPPSPLGEYTIRLFPFWPLTEPAAFENHLAKGGHLLSAAWDNTTQSVVSPVTITAAHGLDMTHTQLEEVAGAAESLRCSLLSPWPAASPASIHVVCGGAAVAVDWAGAVLSFDAPLLVPCTISVESN